MTNDEAIHRLWYFYDHCHNEGKDKCDEECRSCAEAFKVGFESLKKRIETYERLNDDLR